MNDRILEERLAEFAPLTATDSDTQMKNCYESIQKNREEIGLMQRYSMISQIAFFTAEVSPYYDIKNLIQQNPNESLDLILPQQVQFISKLYEFLVFSPMELTKITINAYKIFPKEKFLIYQWSVIPSLFGYFTYIEHIYFASQFYTVFVTHAPKEIAYLVLAPFFRATMTYPYIESIFNDLINFFCKDARLPNKNSAKHNEEYILTFVQSIFSNLNKLPASHLNLLKFLKAVGYSVTEIFHFLVDVFVVPSVRILLKASPFEYSLKLYDDFVPQVPNYIKEKEYSIFLAAKSMYEVPSGYTEFNQQFIEYIASPYEASLITECSKDCIEFPRLIKMIMNNQVTESTINSPIWFKIFPKRNYQPDTVKLRNIVFPPAVLEEQNVPSIPSFERRWRMLDSSALEDGVLPQDLLSKKPFKYFLNDEVDGITFRDYAHIIWKNNLKIRATKFETFMNLQLALEKIKKYSHQVHDFAQNIIFSQCTDMFNTLFKNTKPKNIFTVSLLSFSKIFDAFPHIHQFAIALQCQIFTESFLLKHKNMSKLIEKQWKQMIETSEYNTIPSCLKNNSYSKSLILNRAFFNASTTLNVIGYVPMSMQFFLILDCVSKLSKICNDEENLTDLCVYSIRICSSPVFINCMLSISGGLLTRSEFVDSCTDEERVLWFAFLNGLHKFMEPYTELEQNFYRLHDMLSSEFE